MTVIDDIADDMAKATASLNDAIRGAETMIQGLGLGVSSEVLMPPLPGDREDWSRTIAFGKLNDKWQLIFGEGTDEDFKEVPLLSASRQIRTLAVDMISPLVEALMATAASQAAFIAAKAQQLSEWSEGMRDKGRTR